MMTLSLNITPPHLSKDLSAKEALDKVMAGVLAFSQQQNPKMPLSTETLPLMQALGRVLAKPIVATYDMPPFNTSAMDGYAIVADDLTTLPNKPWRVIGKSLAGRPFMGQVSAGEAVKITTGAVVPQGADTVIMQERVQRHIPDTATAPANSTIEINDTVELIPATSLQKTIKKGQHIRHMGEDLKLGDMVLPSGRRLSAQDCGLIASLGYSQVMVVRRLKVAIFSTGDELVNHEQSVHPIKTGQIFDSNRATLKGLLMAMNIEVIDLGIVPDKPQAIELAINKAAATCDVIITTGGVSVGEADEVRHLLSKQGSVEFWRLNIKPGRHMAFGFINASKPHSKHNLKQEQHQSLPNTCFFGLSGNPVAMMIGFREFVEPALYFLEGVRDHSTHRPSFWLPTINAFQKSAGRREFLRGVLCCDLYCNSGENPPATRVEILSNQGAGALSSMRIANCWVIVPESVTTINVGDMVMVQCF